MLSYQHAFHAGNHADILKHYVLVSVIKYMNKKDKPYTFFDTHAGSGLYRTDDERAQKTGEIETGVMKLMRARKVILGPDSQIEDTPIVEQVSSDNVNVQMNDLDNAIYDFLSYLKSYIDRNEYPGSPIIEADFLRAGDFLVLSELHPKEIENLKLNMRNYSRPQTQFPDVKQTAQTERTDIKHPQIQIHKRSGFEMLYSLTPPKTKRGVVLIDPSYEEKSDYDDVADAVLRTFKKWNGGVFMVWYPLLSYRMGMIEVMVERITEGVHVMSPNADINDFRLCVSDEDFHKETTLSETETPRLFGSGMLVINPPWTLKTEMEKTLPLLEQILGSL